MAIQLTGSLSISGSVLSSLPIESSSYAITASHALNAGGGGGAAFPHTGSAIISGSLEVTGSTDFSYKKVVAEAWSTTANLPYATTFFNSRATGTTNATVAQGGNGGSGPSLSSCKCTLEYNGSTWSEAANGMTNATQLGPMVGTQNSALTFGSDYYGYIGNCTHLYNGTSWSDTGHAHNCSCGLSGGFGTSNAAVKTGGVGRYGTHIDGVEEYNGSAWTVVTALPSAQGGQGSAGTQNAGVIFGCQNESNFSAGTTTTLEYNGSTWSTGGSLSVARRSPGSAKNGTQNGALATSGVTYNTAIATEKYDGTNWSAAASWPGSREHGVGGSGDLNSALAFGGKNGYVGSTNSYEYAGASEEQVSNLSADTNGIIKMTELGANLNFANDTAAAAGGVPIGGLYHTSGTIKIRLT